MKRYSISWIRRLNIFKMLILPKLIYRFNIIPTQMPDGLKKKIECYSKMYMNMRKIQNSQNNVEKKNKVVGLILPTLRLIIKLS